MSSKDDLVDLARRAKACDPQAFGELFDLYFEKLRRYICYQIGDLDMAEELASEVFSKALGSISRFDDRGGTLGAWLYGIARNLVARQRESLAKNRPVDFEEVLSITDGNTPEQAFLRNESYGDLYRAIGVLSDDHRDVVFFRFIEGHDVKTVAELMDKKPAAVRLLQHRAIIALRGVMGTMGETTRGDGQ